jgi:hypothetical protein
VIVSSPRWTRNLLDTKFARIGARLKVAAARPAAEWFDVKFMEISSW